MIKRSFFLLLLLQQTTYTAENYTAVTEEMKKEMAEALRQKRRKEKKNKKRGLTPQERALRKLKITCERYPATQPRTYTTPKMSSNTAKKASLYGLGVLGTHICGVCNFTVNDSIPKSHFESHRKK